MGARSAYVWRLAYAYTLYYICVRHIVRISIHGHTYCWSIRDCICSVRNDCAAGEQQETMEVPRSNGLLSICRISVPRERMATYLLLYYRFVLRIDYLASNIWRLTQ